MQSNRIKSTCRGHLHVVGRDPSLSFEWILVTRATNKSSAIWVALFPNFVFLQMRFAMVCPNINI
jgi:hypothetical protein